ncbi:TetR/AcrR family transcriptional regulator [Enemella evansiae]|uniref:TetR family transcriptional regulator n=1 Tax=Enemella evansiae TaxID=2016499 RepID=A0A255GTC8_9ACTN|nr:TetR family transcriptional regulator [Enemella evansiae]PFG65636.1 TetR family transcriptional regulator [Propionibacteriaceae bacterium ES.041]OYN96386.1 TetR family transcriptional regulator [Enemella evansiae]OYN98741.1 TetR family transcriptional regulator [Enemella evansiae]OYO01902.1 TetR family transcriptional regulator [Enemella evansiae]OYO10928.1 TetR family transcriptional regulator [Enemella evansiae]
MTITGRRAQAKAQKRARICAAADELFRAQGYAGTTTQQVADVADVAAGTVFTYAASKPELLMMVMNHRLRTELARGMAAAEDVTDPLAGIMTLLTPLLELAAADRETFVLFVREVLFGNEGEHRAESQAAIDQLTTSIGAVVQRAPGHRSELDAEAVGRAVLSVVLIELNRIRRGRTAPNRELVANQVELVLKGALNAR